ncbi:hypothetical protein T4D_4310 [Trichinella pseudospiralis]|uniref:Uncharacterized protein n=1 Tax=Trichinella pseudospiralis TaxID=6337 RepID=A0A0V1FKK9_TRIPS|nr:hypothetical protein T4D_4310 [Trichinella pseudospiralis]
MVEIRLNSLEKLYVQIDHRRNSGDQLYIAYVQLVSTVLLVKPRGRKNYLLYLQRFSEHLMKKRCKRLGIEKSRQTSLSKLIDCQV